MECCRPAVPPVCTAPRPRPPPLLLAPLTTWVLNPPPSPSGRLRMKLRITRLGAESATTASAMIEKSRLRRAIAAASGVDCERYRIPLQRWSPQTTQPSGALRSGTVALSAANAVLCLLADGSLARPRYRRFRLTSTISGAPDVCPTKGRCRTLLACPLTKLAIVKSQLTGHGPLVAAADGMLGLGGGAAAAAAVVAFTPGVSLPARLLSAVPLPYYPLPPTSPCKKNFLQYITYCKRRVGFVCRGHIQK